MSILGTWALGARDYTEVVHGLRFEMDGFSFSYSV